MMLITIIMSYILTSIIYYHYGQKKFYAAPCQNLYYCLIFSIDQGFKFDPGMVGNTVDPLNVLGDFVNISFLDVLINFVYLFIIKLIIG